MTYHQTYSVRELLLQIAEGDQQAYAAVFHLYREKVYSLAFHITSSVTASEEIVQDTFLKVWQQQQTLPGIQDFDSWLFVVARNHIYTTLKKMARDATFSLPEEYEPADMITAETIIDEKEVRSILAEALERLSPQQKEVYHLLREVGMTREAVAARLGLSPETVKVHLARAMRSVRAYVVARLPLSAALFILWRYL